MAPELAGNPRILIIEDDADLIELLRLNLKAAGYQVIAATDGQEGLVRFQSGPWALVILDWMLPSLSGIEVLRAIRYRDSRTPVLMLTARGDESDKVLGLEQGCDDYLTKPFSIRELVARVKVLRRRIERAEELARISAKVTVRMRPVQLTVKEYNLLHTLAARPGRIFSRQQLLDLVWNQDSDLYEHTVNSHINRLRNKIEENPNRPRLILTVWGIGYRFTDEI
jgi:DNA-binding response OmpR family regulator